MGTGATVGAAIGTVFAPGLGTAIGGVVGGLFDGGGGGSAPTVVNQAPLPDYANQLNALSGIIYAAEGGKNISVDSTARPANSGGAAPTYTTAGIGGGILGGGITDTTALIVLAVAVALFIVAKKK